jgi:hypothetical protein
LYAASVPSGRRPTTSVNVPPRSIQNSQRLIIAASPSMIQPIGVAVMPPSWTRLDELCRERHRPAGLPRAPRADLPGPSPLAAPRRSGPEVLLRQGYGPGHGPAALSTVGAQARGPVATAAGAWAGQEALS